MTYEKIAIIADKNQKSQDLQKKLLQKHKELIDLEKNPQTIKEIQAIVALGGDGFMLHSLHKYMDLKIPLYGINCGTIGFLMNIYEENANKNLIESINNSEKSIIHPLKMNAIDENGDSYSALAINEVALIRQTNQTAKIKVITDNHTRIEALMSDGILVSTPAGSTAYNLSVHGPIIPFGADILAITPISPFRPRYWRGALLASNSKIRFEILNYDKRPISATADYTEVRNVTSVEIQEDRSHKLQILFDQGQSLGERILREQFVH